MGVVFSNNDERNNVHNDINGHFDSLEHPSKELLQNKEDDTSSSTDKNGTETEVSLNQRKYSFLRKKTDKKASETKSIQEMSEEEVQKFERDKTLYNDGFFDEKKVESLTDEQKQELISAKKLLWERVYDDVEISAKLKKFNNSPLYNIWQATVYPSDYAALEAAGRIDKKLEFFENDYFGSDKDEKIQRLKAFIEAGKKYEEEKAKILKDYPDPKEKYEKAEQLLAKYENPNNPYSQKRKDAALWIKTSNAEQGLYVARKILQKNAALVFEKLSKEERDAIYEYTQSYSGTNSPLRSKDYPHKESFPQQSLEKKSTFTKRVMNITKAIDAAGGLPQDMWFQRGTDNLQINNVKGLTGVDLVDVDPKDYPKYIGTVLKDHGFLSCGSSKGTGFSGSIIMNIYCPRSTNALYIEGNSFYKGSAENETLIQRGYTYKINKIEKKGYKVFVDVDLLLGTDSEKYDEAELEILSNQHF